MRLNLNRRLGVIDPLRIMNYGKEFVDVVNIALAVGIQERRTQHDRQRVDQEQVGKRPRVSSACLTANGLDEDSNVAALPPAGMGFGKECPNRVLSF